MIFIRPTIIRSQEAASSLSRQKYNFLRAQQILLNSQNRGLYNNQGNTLEQWQENLKAVDLRADSSTKKPISPPIRPQDIEIIERSFQSPKYRKKAR